MLIFWLHFPITIFREYTKNENICINVYNIYIYLLIDTNVLIFCLSVPILTVFPCSESSL